MYGGFLSYRQTLTCSGRVIESNVSTSTHLGMEALYEGKRTTASEIGLEALYEIATLPPEQQ